MKINLYSIMNSSFSIRLITFGHTSKSLILQVERNILCTKNVCHRIKNRPINVSSFKYQIIPKRCCVYNFSLVFFHKILPMRLSRSSINFLFVRTRGRWGENEIGRERETKEALSISMIIVWLLYEAVIFIFHGV